MNYDEQALVFDCVGEPSIGIISRPTDAPAAHTGLLIVVGGPQYRVGSHRLFVKLARHAASQGFPAMRFDYRGMGDSWAELRSFETVHDDVQAAVNAFFREVPTLQRVVLWGLCDGASASCMYAPSDKRVQGLILINPWVHTTEGGAITRLRHYYVRRLLDAAFWRKVLTGQVGVRALNVLLDTVRQALAKRVGRVFKRSAGSGLANQADALPLPSRIGHQVRQSGIPFAMALSDEDPIAQEFEDQAMPTSEWQQAVSRQLIQLARLTNADHTITSPEARDQLCQLTVDWMRDLSARSAPP